MKNISFTLNKVKEEIKNRLFNMPSHSFSFQNIVDNFLDISSRLNDKKIHPNENKKISQPKLQPLSYPLVDPALCIGCGLCAEICPNNAISINKIAKINETLCSMCKKCYEQCPWGAISMIDSR